jgi:hypothetical protein
MVSDKPQPAAVAERISLASRSEPAEPRIPATASQNTGQMHWLDCVRSATTGLGVWLMQADSARRWSESEASRSPVRFSTRRAALTENRNWQEAAAFARNPRVCARFSSSGRLCCYTADKPPLRHSYRRVVFEKKRAERRWCLATPRPRWEVPEAMR